MKPKISYSLNKIRQGRTLLLLLLIIGLFILLTNNLTIDADDDDEDDEDDDDFEDISKNLGWASVGLFAVSAIYIVLYQFFRLTRRITEESKLYNFKSNYSNFFRTIRKPLLYTHYLAGLAALGILLAHGILLADDDTEAVIGWVTAGIYIFYIITGVLLWFKIIHPKRNKKFRKVVLYVHRSMLVFAIAIVIHIVHLAIAD